MSNINKAQVAAFLQAVLAVAVAFGLSLSQQQQTALLSLSGVFAAAIVLADGFVRAHEHRARGDVAAAMAAASAPAAQSAPEVPAQTA